MTTVATSYWPADTSVPVQETTVGSVLRAAAAAAPDMIAMVGGLPDPAQRGRWTYAELLAEAEQAARALSARFAPGERVAVFVGVPTMMIAMLGHPDIERRDLSSLRAAVSGGSPVPAGLVRQVEAKLGVRFSIVFGTTEDMIIRGGENIYPRETEDLLFAHPAVAEAVVIGVPDETWGEVVAAYVRPVPGQPAPSPGELRAYCREHLAPYKTPQHWVFVEAFPMTASGKIQKYKLREDFARRAEA